LVLVKSFRLKLFTETEVNVTFGLELDFRSGLSFGLKGKVKLLSDMTAVVMGTAGRAQ